MKHSVALFPAQGIGDAILMNILALFAKERGDDVSLWHPQHKALKALLPSLDLQAPLPLDALEIAALPFDTVFVQNDHSALAHAMDALRRKNNDLSIIFIHPTRSKLERAGDIVFSPHQPFVTNLINQGSPFFSNQVFPIKSLLHPFDKNALRSNKKRIAIHPTSKDPYRNWPASKYIALKEKLQMLGFSPYFIIEKKDRHAWDQYALTSKELPHFNSLNEIAIELHRTNYFIGNDSGIGHIASMVGIPTLTISNSYKRVRMWRPDFCTNLIITPLVCLPNWKSVHLRLRDTGWHHFVSVNAVLKRFNTLREVAP